MTLKHKNTSKWAKRIIQRGLKAKDDGTREAIAEQLRAHTSLTRKMHSIDMVSSSDDSSGDEDASSDANEASDRLPSKRMTRLLAKSKMETLKVLEGDAEAEIPTSGLFSLPFMVSLLYSYVHIFIQDLNRGILTFTCAIAGSSDWEETPRSC